MGIVNLTDDSFYTGNRCIEIDAAVDVPSDEEIVLQGGADRE